MINFQPNCLDSGYAESNCKNPWTRLSTNLAYASPRIRIEEDEVISPDGMAAVYQVVRMRSGVMIASLSSANEVYLVGQYRYAIDSFSWEVIGGEVDDTEAPEKAAERELEEEAGLRANSWTFLNSADLGTAVLKSRIYFYLAEEVTEGEPHPDPSEHLIIKKTPFADALDMVLTGKITHLPSIALLLKVGVILSLRPESQLL